MTSNVALNNIINETIFMAFQLFVFEDILAKHNTITYTYTYVCVRSLSA